MFSLDFLQATEEAALACAPWIGANNEHAADQAAVDAMRRFLNTLPIDGTVVIGEGEIDEAPMLYIGEKLGMGGTKVDIAVDPLEGTKITAKGKMNAMSVLAVANEGCFLHAPDCYMEKIVTGPLGKGLIDLSLSATENIKKFAKTKYCSPKEITIALLNRPRHAKLMKEIDKLGAKIHLIDDGDILAGIATCLENSRVDMLMGIGGAPEGVLTAAAVKCMGGYMQARLVVDTPELLKRTQEMGIQDNKKIYTLNELAAGDVAFFATGVTDGYFLKGTLKGGTHSVVMHSNGLVRFINRTYGEKT